MRFPSPLPGRIHLVGLFTGGVTPGLSPAILWIASRGDENRQSLCGFAMPPSSIGFRLCQASTRWVDATSRRVKVETVEPEAITVLKEYDFLY